MKGTHTAIQVHVEQGYDRWAPTYDSTPNPLVSCEERHVRSLLPAVAGKQVLDLACGTGRWMEVLAARQAQVMGVDVSAAMLGAASRKATVKGRLSRADGRRLPFRPCTFDFAICSFSLSHVLELNEVLSELRQVMTPQSGVFVTEMHPEAHTLGWRTRFRDTEGVVEITTIPRTADSLVRSFHAEGFDCVHRMPFHFGEPERALFAATGRSDLFEAACRTPAILFCHFQLAGRARSNVSP